MQRSTSFHSIFVSVKKLALGTGLSPASFRDARFRPVVRLLFAVVIFAFMPPTVASAQQAAPIVERFPAALDAYIAKTLIDGHIPGIAIGIVRNDSTMVARGYGVRELGKAALVDGNTVFDIASLSKAFTATAAAILVDRGVLRWDDPVRRHLPDLVLPTPELTANATVRDFLSHRTGLEAANAMWLVTAVDRAEALRRLRFLKVRAPLRERMIYSNIGYSVAGEAAAAAAHRPFADLVRDLVVKPLGLSSTTWTYEQAATMPNLAVAHATIGGRQQPIRREIQRQPIAAAAGVQSTVNDLTRWMRLHLNDGVLDGTRYVSDSSMRAMHSIQVPIATTPAMRAARLVQDTVIGYGMGWQIMDYRGHPLLWHTGNGDGQIAFMALLPRDRIGVVVLVNTWSAPLVHAALINRILDTYLGYPPRDWVGETLARVPGMIAADDSAHRAMLAGKSVTGPSRPLAAYAGRFDEPLFGPVFVRVDGARLVLQMGTGQMADLDHHHDDTFLVRWRDPLFQENFMAPITFNVAGGSIESVSLRINADAFTARKAVSGKPER